MRKKKKQSKGREKNEGKAGERSKRNRGRKIRKGKSERIEGKQEAGLSASLNISQAPTGEGREAKGENKN